MPQSVWGETASGQNSQLWVGAVAVIASIPSHRLLSSVSNIGDAFGRRPLIYTRTSRCVLPPWKAPYLAQNLLILPSARQACCLIVQTNEQITQGTISSPQVRLRAIPLSLLFLLCCNFGLFEGHCIGEEERRMESEGACASAWPNPQI